MQNTSIDPHLKRREFLLRLMFGLGVRPDEVDDLTQDALLRFYGRGYAERELPEQAEKGLLARVGFSCVVDAHRRRRGSNMGDTDILVPDPEVEVAYDFEDLNTLIERAGLTDEQIRLLECRFGEDLSLRQVAARFDLHLNTVRRRLDQALEKLRRCASADARGALVERSTG